MHLRSRILDAGASVYWKIILKATRDPTFVLLLYMWYAMYAWDQALEQLYSYISTLERLPTESYNEQHTQTLHTILAHLLSYKTMLRDFKKSVQFILETPDTTRSYDDEERSLMARECNTLISEIERLELDRETHTERLKNAIHLLFSSTNLSDSKQMQKLTKATVRDSHAMKQVSILTMLFLPGSFMASVFGMNVRTFSSDPNIKGTLLHYIEWAIPLTLITVWLIVAFHTEIPQQRWPAERRPAFGASFGNLELHDEFGWSVSFSPPGVEAPSFSGAIVLPTSGSDSTLRDKTAALFQRTPEVVSQSPRFRSTSLDTRGQFGMLGINGFYRGRMFVSGGLDPVFPKRDFTSITHLAFACRPIADYLQRYSENLSSVRSLKLIVATTVSWRDGAPQYATELLEHDPRLAVFQCTEKWSEPEAWKDRVRGGSSLWEQAKLARQSTLVFRNAFRALQA
ncbi:hypothetical protein H0H92_011435 [Tricholoma furcatifolium]|nr:hypothetical protein H0H92_011435 [Tricholoma furcatifolium]